MININCHPISYRLKVIADYCSNFGQKNGHFAFLSPPSLGGLGATYTVHLRLIGKLVLDFLLVLIQLFFAGVNAEELRTNIFLEIGVFKENGSVLAKFSCKRKHPL